jgi:hypothetical protein
MATVAQGTTIHCNRCDKEFEAGREMIRGSFCGTKAARLEQFCKCPHCGQNDSHWIYAADAMPAFEGGFDARKRAERQWLREN